MALAHVLVSHGYKLLMESDAYCFDRCPAAMRNSPSAPIYSRHSALYYVNFSSGISSILPKLPFALPFELCRNRCLSFCGWSRRLITSQGTDAASDHPGCFDGTSDTDSSSPETAEHTDDSHQSPHHFLVCNVCCASHTVRRTLCVPKFCAYRHELSANCVNQVKAAGSSKRIRHGFSKVASGVKSPKTPQKT